MRSSITTILLIAILTGTMALGGCSDDESSTAPPPPDTDPPLVINVFVENATQMRVFFNEPVEQLTAERAQNYLIIKRPTPQSTVAAPGDTIQGATAVLVGQDVVLLSIIEAMTTAEYDVFVVGVSDLRGNIIETPVSRRFIGTDILDQTAPTIVSVSPEQQEGNVGLRQSVVVTFDEPMHGASTLASFTWETTTGGVPVPFQGNMQDLNVYVFTPLVDLELFTAYTATVRGTARDLVGNVINPPIFWIFATTATGDLLRPSLVTTNPEDGSVNVARDVLIRLTFTEPIDPASIDNGGTTIEFNPDPGDGIFTTTDGGISIRFSPDSLLQSNTQYTILIPEGSVTDFAGNPLDATSTIRFTTGSAFAGGQIAGKVAGDPSTQASNPLGATVVATTNSPFADGDDDTQVQGTGVVDADSNYAMDRLPDGWYFPFGIMDSNNDGFLDPETGDAIGAYGVDFRQTDLTIDSVQVTGGGSLSDVNFPLFDPLAISGTVFYAGTQYANVLVSFDYFVGAFDTTTFDTTMGFPPADFGTNDGENMLGSPHYRISEFNTENVEDGTYWIGAFLDIDGDTEYDPAIEPAGFFSVNDNAFPVTIEDGRDARNINIFLEDPNGGMNRSSAWRGGDGQISKRMKLLQRFRANTLRALGQAER